MPTNTESLNRELFRLLSKYKPKPLDAEGKATPVPDEADIFKFEFTKDGEDYGTVYVTLDEDRVLTVYFGDDVSDSPGDKTPGVDYDDTWSGLLHQLSAWRMTKGLRGFKTQNKDRVSDDMARRNHMRNKDKIAEGYYPMGKSRSYSDAVPSVKIVIEHSRVIEEGEQRYRNINRIFLENQDGERYLLDTKKPGIARVYARHIAEGGKVNDDRWNHVHSLCEEYSKMAGFVRATRNGQFNESAQSLVNEGIAHYQSLRESLSRMTGKRGYNAYFENWTPSLMEDEGDETNLNELFVQETLDPRIESVMPILNRIHKKVSESVVDKEMNKLAEWADSLVEEESIKSNNPVGIPEEVDMGQYDARKSTPKGGTTPEQEKEFRKKVQAYGKELEQRQKEKEKGVTEGSHEDQVSRLAAYNEKMAGENPPIDLGLREVGNWAKVGHYGDPIKTAWFNIAKYGIRNNKFNDSVDQAMSAIGDFPDKYDLSIPEIDALYSAYETVYDQWEQSKSERGVAEDLDANQKRVGQLGPTEKVGPKGAVGKLVGANENFINTVDQAVTTEEDEMAEGILDNIKNMFKPKDPTPVTPITADDIAKGYQTQPEFKAQVDQIAKQQGISPQELIKQLQQQAGGGVAQNASVPTQAFHEGLMDTLKKGIQGVKKFGQDAKAAGKEAWDEVVPQLKQDWKHPIQAALAKEGEMDEGAHTQHYHDANKFTGDIDHGERPPTDWSTDPIEAGTDRIHQKIASVLKRLSKPEHKTQTDTDESVSGEFAGGTAGALVGGALGAGIGPVGAAVGSAAGSTAGQMAGRELTKEEQLNEFAPLIAAGARLILPALARVGPILGRWAATAGKAGAEVAGKTATGVGRGAADVAKSAAQSAAQNAGKIGVGAGAYQAITDVANSAVGGVGQVYHDVGSATSAIVQAVGNSIDKATIAELATAAVKYAIPVGILLALLYGGKKLLDKVMGGDAEPAPAGAMVKEGQDDLDRILTIMNHRR